MKSLFAFVHIEKAAGMTLIHILRRNFLFRYIDVRPLNKSSNGTFSYSDLKKYQLINPFLNCIGGHSVLPFSDLEKNVDNLMYFTCLRDPFKRYISQFRYLHYINRIPNNFELFLNNQEYSNIQTKKLSKNCSIEEAKYRLNNMFQVGAVEEFNFFLMRLKKSLYPYVDFKPQYKIQNVTPKNISSDTLYNKYKDIIFQNNNKDIELYDYLWNELIPYRNSEYGSKLTDDVNKFEKENLHSTNFKTYIDYSLRKLYYAPVSGLIRKFAGLNARGSY